MFSQVLYSFFFFFLKTRCPSWCRLPYLLWLTVAIWNSVGILKRLMKCHFHIVCSTNLVSNPLIYLQGGMNGHTLPKASKEKPWLDQGNVNTIKTVAPNFIKHKLFHSEQGWAVPAYSSCWGLATPHFQKVPSKAGDLRGTVKTHILAGALRGGNTNYHRMREIYTVKAKVSCKN